MSREQREALRRRAREQRSALSRSAVRRNSERVVRLLQTLEKLSRAQVLMGYMAIENEVDVWPYLEACWLEGKTVLLPRVEKDRATMVAVPYTGPDNISTGDFGIREPLGAVFPPDRIEVVIVPGVAFDRRGYRLGYGKGYYDRFLTCLRPSAFICGVAHSCQVVSDIMPHAGDFRIPCLVTEKGVLNLDVDDPGKGLWVPG
ncbi:MAG: 5-formyltetrahydrofolate cyclo-ligase [Syntrophomonadaceae bacterium]|nr:5-formyltetrahydrofolate cyclo-ligase [Syntrophomonadaceae bacterium]